MSEQKQQRYQVVKGPDGTFWIPLQPLILDLNDKIAEIEGSAYPQGHKDEFSLNCQIVRGFLQSMWAEGRDKEAANGNA